MRLSTATVFQNFNNKNLSHGLTVAFLFQILVYRANIIAQTNASLVKGGGFCEAKDGGIIIKYNLNHL